eukprot:GHVT01088500.1.p1 GENE.GHVT01088500.1~~GHVT01088500.1.p1  ORF type:complete len:389 (+),score=45.16 GHVT01088500.1:1771-2937(+)
MSSSPAPTRSMAVRLSLNVLCDATRPGDALLVVGSSSYLGDWAPEAALPLLTDNASWPKWSSGELILGDQPIEDLEFKFIIRQATGAIKWEPLQDNRHLDLQPWTHHILETSWSQKDKSKVTRIALAFRASLRPSSMLTGGEQAAPPLQNGAGDTRGIHPDSHSGIVPSNEWDDKSSEHENPSRRLQSQHAAAAKMEFPTSYVPVNIMRSTIPPQSHPVDPAAMAAARKCAIEHLRHRRSGFAGEANEDDLPTPDDVSQEENGDSTDDFNYFSDSRRSIERTAFILQRTDPIAQHYDIGRTIGRGTWGEVKAVYHRLTGAKRAAKKIPKFYVEDVERFRQEITIMKSLDHPNIVRLHEAFEDDMDIYLVMEFCAGEGLGWVFLLNKKL